MNKHERIVNSLKSVVKTITKNTKNTNFYTTVLKHTEFAEMLNKLNGCIAELENN